MDKNNLEKLRLPHTFVAQFKIKTNENNY